MIENLQNYYLNKEEPNQSCLITLKNFILEQDENITENFKWGLPCFLYKNKMFCFLSIDKKTSEPYLLFVEGRNLEHPKLETGDRKRMKIFRVNPNADLPIKTIGLLIKDALDLYRDGMIKTKEK